MEIKKSQNISVINRFWNIINHGLLLFGIRNRLAKLGFDINPYYWVQEEVVECQEPKIKGNPSEYSVRYLNIEEFKLINTNTPLPYLNEMIEDLKNGQQCIGLEHNDEIAAYMFIELNSFVHYKKTFKFEISPGTHNSIIWDKIIKILKKNGIKVELKS